MTDKLRFYLQLMSYFTLILVITTIFITFYWKIKKYEPITFNRSEFKVDTKIVKQGDYLSFHVDYCKDNNFVPIVTTNYIDGIIYSIPKEPQPFYEKGCGVKNFLVYIPKALPVGKYYLLHTYSFQVNPLRQVVVKAKTEMFEVIK